MSNRAWVTLATNDSYGLGALVLAHSLRRANSAYSAVVLVTPSVTEAMRNRLRGVFAEVITVDVLDSKDAAHLAMLQRPELGITFTKIHCWSLTQYQKCVFLDADTLIVQNCDELFEREELSAAPDVGWPDCFNSGVFVYVPSSDTYTRLITFAQERGSFDGGDQGLLNAFFSDWARGDINKHLPFLYNVTSAAFYSYIPALKHYGQDLKIIHFIGSAKPWLQNFNWETRAVDAPEHLRELLQLWWDLFVGQVHPQLDTAMESSVEVEDPIEPPPENPPEDIHRIFHYEPRIDPESEFSWHHPEPETNETEIQAQKIDMADIYDPWKHYRGNMPSYTQSSSDGGNYNQGEVTINTWEHREPNEFENNWQKPIHEKSHDHQYYEQHQEQNNTSHHSNNSQLRHNQEQHQHYHQHTHVTNWSDQHQHLHQHSWRHHDNGNHSHSDQDLHYSSHGHHHTEPVQNHNHWQSEQQVHIHVEQTHHCESHNHNYQAESQQKGPEHYYANKYLIVTEENIEKHEHNSNYHRDYNKYFNLFTMQPRVEPVYRVHLDHRRRPRRQRKMDRDHICPNRMNGHVSDSDSEDEFIIPRHPYDGFYLRHTSTIDPRGRKICLHEIPPTPSPTPSLEEEPLLKLPSPVPEDYETASECEEQYSGVAGNLARVVPGSSDYQREAIDELTRRQGWEAGNIDYMGADSFENIWAKISQTLNQQPPKEPSPPRKEPSPPKQPSPPKEVPKQEPAPVAAPAPQTPEPTPEPQVPAPQTLVPESSAAQTPVLQSPAPQTPAPQIPSPSPAAPVPAPESTQKAAPVESKPEVLKTVEDVLKQEAPKDKTEKKSTVPATPPATPKSTPEASTPVSETPTEPLLAAEVAPAPAEMPKAAALEVPSSPAPAAEAPQPKAETPQHKAEAPQPETTPEKAADTTLTTSSTDSPPLAHTPSKEEAPAVPAAKSEERRKPAGKLQLSPPAAADPLPTPDSELEDAAALAHAIIASELAVSSPSPAATPVSPPLPQDEKRLSIDAPEVPTPPVSLEQIGIKSKAKPTTAAQIESSVSEKAEPAKAAPQTSTTPPTSTEPAPGDAKKKVTKKAGKKESGSSSDAPTPVPPPRKKEKKPKDK